MADILIKGMEMPEYCYDCPLHNSEYGSCNILDRATIDPPRDCPLVEVKPHGDLVDRDKLLKLDNITFIDCGHWMADYEAVKTSVIENAPVVVEASE